MSQAVSQVKGRQHDAGTIVGYKTAGGLTVLVLDRWSVKGMSDSKLASQGVLPVPHTDSRYYDQNKGKTYTVPVNPSAPDRGQHLREVRDRAAHDDLDARCPSPTGSPARTGPRRSCC